ncbi:hypothetical protein AAZX31_03G109800 [Glycine max]|uniref:CLE38 protein n=3 Tax=Glycine subgen. Soja TaxID=1462606 RepID=E9L584_SOYBN|nr:CLE38 protein [Glycine max]KAG5043239.1 hypothetical protein JHK87_007154 [Glycine soja]KAG5055020.1 hypothetical protein JHK85_007530 [Glycine max]KAG5072102.1 hypothetical protein JHK86_007313 [Glycine max]KHN30344.1 hypothetical protein glysoja_025835 [Glycine soja]
MICVKRNNNQQKMSCVILFLLLLLLLLLLSTTPCHAAARKARFDTLKGGSSSDDEFKFKPSNNFHGTGLQGNTNAQKDGDQVFGADKRKVYTGPNPLHNR